GPSPRQVNLNVTSMYSSGLFISEIKMDQPALALLTFIDTNASCSKQNRGAKQSVSKPCSNGLAFARHGGGAGMGYAGQRPGTRRCSAPAAKRSNMPRRYRSGRPF